MNATLNDASARHPAACLIERNIHDALARKEDASTLLLRDIQKPWRSGGKEKAQRVLGGV